MAARQVILHQNTFQSLRKWQHNVSTFTTSGHLSVQICYIPQYSDPNRVYITQKNPYTIGCIPLRARSPVYPSACYARPSSSFPLATQRAGRVFTLLWLNRPFVEFIVKYQASSFLFTSFNQFFARCYNFYVNFCSGEGEILNFGSIFDRAAACLLRPLT